MDHNHYREKVWIYSRTYFFLFFQQSVSGTHIQAQHVQQAHTTTVTTAMTMPAPLSLKGMGLPA